jgi:serine/threonine protein phosphatase PrpC
MQPPSSSLKTALPVAVFGQTDIGRRRSKNEDNYFFVNLSTNRCDWDEREHSFQLGEGRALLVVADGMGGASAGAVASEMAVKTIRDALMMPSYHGGDMRLRYAVEMANQRIHKQAQHDPNLCGMGTTVTAALVEGRKGYIAQVGDSRAYLLRNLTINQLTKDQTLAQYLVDIGQIAPPQMSTIRQNIIMQALGAQETVQVALSSVELRDADHLLLCSDGLSNKVSAKEMCEIVGAEPNLNAACERLVSLANTRGGEDNITVVVAHFDGRSMSAGRMNAAGNLDTIG